MGPLTPVERPEPDQRKRIVADGYDLIADRYPSWAARIEADPRDRMIEAFAREMPANGRVLDLGCGSGVPSTAALATRYHVTGIDISTAQIDLARRNVPGATFLVADMTALDLPDASFDGATAFYSISHVPREEHRGLFDRAYRWLAPGGLFLAALSASDDPGWTGEWLGVPMFFSGFDAATNRRLLRERGFQLLVDELVEIREPEGPATFQWVLGSKPAG